MKICISSTGNNLDAKVDEHFGKAAWFLIVNPATFEYEAVPNAARSASGGRGTEAAQLVLEKGVDAVVTGIIGPNAFSALTVGLVEVYDGASPEESVRDAVSRFTRGEYRQASAPTGGPGR